MKPANLYITRGHHPFVRFLLALLLGVALGVFVPSNSSVYLVLQLLIGGLGVSFFFILLLQKRYSDRLSPWSGITWLTILMFVGWVSIWKTDPNIDNKHFSRHDATVLIGYIADEPVVRGEHIRFPLNVTSSYHQDTLYTRSGTLFLTIRLDSTSNYRFEYGQTIAIRANYNEVAPPFNPGELNYRRYLVNKNIWHQTYIRTFDDFQLLNEFQGSSLVSYALWVRQRMVAKFGRYLSNQDALSIASTLILGYRADLSQDLIEAFSTTGTIHVLSVSGMHVVIVFWLLSKLLWWMDKTKSLRLTKWAVLIVCVWLYALITGFSPSVLRASIMISFVITAGHFSRQARVYNSIAASAFFLILYNPKFVLDVGFQLSYLAVLSIVFLMPLLQKLMPVRNRFVRPVWNYSLMSISAQAGAFPLATFYFNQFPMYFLPANLLIVIPATVIMYLGFAVLLIPFASIRVWLGLALERLILAMNEILFSIEQLPFASLRGVWLASWEYIVLYIFMLAIVFSILLKWRSLVYTSLLCLLLLLLSSFWTLNEKIFERSALFYNVRGNLAIGIINRNDVLLFSNLISLDDRTLQYSVVPHLEYYTSSDRIKLITTDSTYQSDKLIIQSGLIQWFDRRLFIYEDDPVIDFILPVDVLFLRGNPRRSLADIVKLFPCEKLIIDGSNYDNTIDRFRVEADSLSIPLYVLKNNFAYVWAYSN